MKHEWRKHEKEIYGTSTKPTLVVVPNMKYFTISGEGNPNSENFAQAVEALYSASYAIRMSNKKGTQPNGYYEYTVYPLEGFWSLDEIGIEEYKLSKKINKDHLTFKLMIRQPDFVHKEYAESILKEVSKNKPYPSNELLRFEEIEEGLCLQILHKGSYDDEPESFRMMQDYCNEHKLVRLTHDHKEIYLNDARKSAPENNKTILRIPVTKNE